MFESDKRSPLDRLKKGLYSRNSEFKDASRHGIHGEQADVPKEWAPELKEPAGETPSIHKSRRVYSYLFIGALGFFIIAAIVGGYTLFGGRNFISVQNVDIIVEGPASIGGGETLDLDVSIQNKNATDIELVDLIVEYPPGTKDPSDPSADMSKVRHEVGDIGAQRAQRVPVRALVFGEEGAEREIKLTAEYRTAGSNAIFFKEKIYKFSISSSPVIVTIDAMERVSGGQHTDVSVTIVSNADVPLKNLLLSLDYPFGFTPVSASPQPAYGNSVWRIGDLAPGANRVVKIRFKAEGQNDEERTLHANVGIQSENNEREIATTIIAKTHTFHIEKPFLALDLTLNGVRSDVAAEPGRPIKAEVLWINNSPLKITNARIEAKLAGNVLDKNSVRVEYGGYYDSLSNSIIWETGRTTGLESIAPGEDGRVGFTFSTQSATPGQSVADPIVTITVSARGSRVDEYGTPSEINSAVSRSAKLVSNLALSSRALRSQGPLTNSGPIPPRVDQVTTYTIVWTVTNTSNNITGARVVANLPAHVSWTGAINPSDAQITYNPTGGGIVWNVGSIPRNANVGSGAKQVYFQVSLRPSANQEGTVPDLLSEARITGMDVFTQMNIENSAPGLTTRTSSDLLYKPGDETVGR